MYEFESEEGIFLSILVFIIVHIAVLIYKTYITKSTRPLSIVIPELYTAGAILYDSVYDINHGFILLGILSIIIGNIAYNITGMLGNRFKLEIYSGTVINSLKNLRDKYDYLFESVPLPIYTINEVGRFEYINKAFADMVESTTHELINKPIYDFYPERLRAEIKRFISERITKPGKEVSYDTTFITKSGKEIPVHINAKTTVNGHVTITGCVVKL